MDYNNDIRKVFNDTLYNGMDRDFFLEVTEGTSDIEVLEIGIEFLKIAKDRLSTENNEQYKELSIVCEKLEELQERIYSEE